MKQPKQQFGGTWTIEKLERVRKYLVAYATIMNKQKFRFAYIDAFAGTGYRTLREEDSGEIMLPELVETDSIDFRQGSARIALKVVPRFDKYIFIEKNEGNFEELYKLKEDHPELIDDITLICAEANTYIQNLCNNRNWKGNRAVMFLDPFGMQVQWSTIQAIAQTEAIDLWILFPLGVAINRLLRRDGNIDPIIRTRLNELFGEEKWYDSFYQTSVDEGLFGSQTKTKKVSDFKAIAGYFVRRLETIFPGVAKNPLPLRNSRNNPLYLLCFVSANPKGAKTAVKIAKDILNR